MNKLIYDLLYEQTYIRFVILTILYPICYTNKLISDSSAFSSIAAAPPIFTPSISSSSLIPIKSILMEQATNSTPFSLAIAIKSSRLSTFLFFMTVLIILAPMPPIFILDSLSFPAPLGIIAPNMVEIKSFFAAVFSGLLSAFSPQKVQNMLTCLPMAAAAFAMIKVAITLSRSPENKMRFFLSQGPLLAAPQEAFDKRFITFFLMVVTATPLLCVLSINTFPVLLQKPSMSEANATSVVEISITSPSFASLIDFESFTIGPGH